MTAFYLEANRVGVPDTVIQPNTNTILDFPFKTGDDLNQWDGKNFTAIAPWTVSINAHAHWRDMQKDTVYGILLVINNAIFWKETTTAVRNSWKDDGSLQTMKICMPAVKLNQGDVVNLQIFQTCVMPCEIGQSLPNSRIIIYGA